MVVEGLLVVEIEHYFGDFGSFWLSYKRILRFSFVSKEDIAKTVSIRIAVDIKLTVFKIYY